jgi:hypothetical protein
MGAPSLAHQHSVVVQVESPAPHPITTQLIMPWHELQPTKNIVFTRPGAQILSTANAQILRPALTDLSSQLPLVHLVRDIFAPLHQPYTSCTALRITSSSHKSHVRHIPHPRLHHVKLPDTKPPSARSGTGRTLSIATLLVSAVLQIIPQRLPHLHPPDTSARSRQVRTDGQGPALPESWRHKLPRPKRWQSATCSLLLYLPHRLPLAMARTGASSDT